MRFAQVSYGSVDSDAARILGPPWRDFRVHTTHSNSFRSFPTSSSGCSDSGSIISITQIISDHRSWLGFVFQLPCDDIQRSCHPLVCADKSAQKPQNVNNDSNDANKISQDK